MIKANKQALIISLITLAYLILAILLAWFSPKGLGILGLPLWFELSCLLLPFVFIVVMIFIIKTTFTLDQK